MSDWWTIFQYSFIIRAIVVGIAIAISSAFLGSFLVLKKFSLIGDGLAHVSFGAIALALVLNQSPVYFTIPIVALAAIIIIRMSDKARLSGDAAIGILSALSIAIGTILINVFGSTGVSIENYLFGNILLIAPSDVSLSIIITIVVVVAITMLYHEYFALTYDEEFARVNKVRVDLLKYGLGILTALVIVIAIRAVGTLLVSSMIIFPTLIAMQMTKSFKSTILLGIIVSVIVVFFGLVASFIFDLPSGSSIVVLYGIIYSIFILLRILKLKQV